MCVHIFQHRSRKSTHAYRRIVTPIGPYDPCHDMVSPLSCERARAHRSKTNAAIEGKPVACKLQGEHVTTRPLFDLHNQLKNERVESSMR